MYNFLFSSSSNSNHIRFLKGFSILTLFFATQFLSTFFEWYLSQLFFDSLTVVFPFLIFACIIFSTFCLFQSLINGSEELHYKMLNGVLFSPMHFYESNTVGRIMNRFSRDQLIVDEGIVEITLSVVKYIPVFFVVLAIAIYANFFYFFFVFLPVIAVCVWCSVIVMRCTRTLRRYESVTRSPVFGALNIIHCGLPVIRALRQQRLLLSEAFSLIDTNSRMILADISCRSWFSFCASAMFNIPIYVILFFVVHILYYPFVFVLH